MSVTNRVTQCLSGTDWLRQETKLGVPKASAWRGVRTRLALRSQQAGARGRAPQARSAAPKQYNGPPHRGTFIQFAAPNEHKTPPHIGTFTQLAAGWLNALEALDVEDKNRSAAYFYFHRVGQKELA